MACHWPPPFVGMRSAFRPSAISPYLFPFARSFPIWASTFPSAGTRLIFTDLLDQGYEPHNVKKLYLQGAEKPDVRVDISGTINLKIAALKKHASQLGDWDPTDMIQEWAADTGKEAGLPSAEAFKVMTLLEDKPPEN